MCCERTFYRDMRNLELNMCSMVTEIRKLFEKRFYKLKRLKDIRNKELSNPNDRFCVKVWSMALEKTHIGGRTG